jgi:hypothetical protein
MIIEDEKWYYRSYTSLRGVSIKAPNMETKTKVS